MNNLKDLRKAKGLTQEDLAKLLNKQQATISAYETGLITPGLNTAMEMSELFNVSVEDIFLNRNTI